MDFAIPDRSFKAGTHERHRYGMRMETKHVLKDDGRSMTFFHFPDSATAEETAIFEALVPDATLHAPNPDPPQSAAPETTAKEAPPHV